jgi:hypothetical protein
MPAPHYSTFTPSRLHTENVLPSPNDPNLSFKNLFPNSPENPRNSIDTPSPLGLTPFVDDTHLKCIREFYAKASPITPRNTILYPPFPSPRFKPHEFFLPREQYIPRKPIHAYTPRYEPRQPYNLAPIPYLVNPPTSSWKFEVGENSTRTTLENQENLVEDILNNLDEIFLDLVQKIEEGHDNNLGTRPDYSSLRNILQQSRFKITKLHKIQMRYRHKIAFARFRICTLVKMIDDDEECHQSNLGNIPNLNP